MTEPGSGQASVVIGFLACPETMPQAGAAQRRGDAFEHDLQVAALRPALAARGLALREMEWRAPLAEFDGVALALLGTAWDYQDHPNAFLAKLEALQDADIAVCNPPELVRWNMDKRYLLDLEAAGARIIPTLWADDPGREDIAAALAQFECEQVVVKRRTGAGALGQHLFSRKDLPAPDWRLGHPAMLQPFMPAIAREGELSCIFIDGAFSHALRKTPAAGDYRIQSLYGGQEEAVILSEADIGAAKAVVDAMPGPTPLYARIDLLRSEDGALLVMEAEAIEPFLYPLQGPELGERMAQAIAARLDQLPVKPGMSSKPTAS